MDDIFLCLFDFFFFFKQKTAYEMRISDWSSDVCSSDLAHHGARLHRGGAALSGARRGAVWHRAAPEVRRGPVPHDPGPVADPEIGRASCRERVCEYVSISVCAGSLQKK